MMYALMTGAGAAIGAAILGGPFVSWLRAQKLGKAISTEGPESHMSKAGTPTFGGLLIMGVGLIAALIAAVPKDADVLLPIAIAAVFVLVGTYDDLGTLVGREQREAHDRRGMIMKIVAFAATGIVAAILLYGPMDAPRLLVPREGHFDIGPGYVVIVVFVIIATASATGVSDGLDMLLGSTSAIAFAAFGAIALMQDQTGVATFCFALVGSLLGFLYWNAHPARIFMGDSGSLALGGALATVAFMTGWWLLIPVIGIFFVVEIASVVIQIGYYRMTGGKRVFRMAPVHHHFEEIGWHEVTVTARFALLAGVGALVGVALASW
jgi:phospho-N-acetylmuramoyl-pentapeptide-transferase